MKSTVDDEVIFGIHEVYYDEQGRPNMYAENPVRCFSEESVESLSREIDRFKAALQQPVLVPEDFTQTSREG